jgi:hypothetical protein
MNAFNDFRVEAWTEDGMWTRIFDPIVKSVKKAFAEVASGVAIGASAVATTLVAAPCVAGATVWTVTVKDGVALRDLANLSEVQARHDRINQMIANLGNDDTSDIDPMLLALASEKVGASARLGLGVTTSFREDAPRLNRS